MKHEKLLPLNFTTVDEWYNARKERYRAIIDQSIARDESLRQGEIDAINKKYNARIKRTRDHAERYLKLLDSEKSIPEHATYIVVKDNDFVFEGPKEEAIRYVLINKTWFSHYIVFEEIDGNLRLIEI